MERNQRISKSAIEESLNQYFSGRRSSSRGNVETSRVSEIVVHKPDNKYGRSVSSTEYNTHYHRNPPENCEQPLFFRRHDIQTGISNEVSGKRKNECINDTIYGDRGVSPVGGRYGSRRHDFRSADSRHYERNSSPRNYSRSENNNNLRNLFSNYNGDRNNGDHYDIKCEPRNDDGPTKTYVGKNIDPSGSVIRFGNNTVGNIGFNNVDRFVLMDTDGFRSDYISGNDNRFDISRNNDHPYESSYNSVNNYFGSNKQKIYTNMSKKSTPTIAKLDLKRRNECQERGGDSKSSRTVKTSSSLNSSTLPSKPANVATPGGQSKNQKKKKKDNRYTARRRTARIRSRVERRKEEAGEVEKIKKGNSKARPEEYWTKWWPTYAYIEKSLPVYDDEDIKSLEPLIKFIYPPPDPKKKILLRQGVNKINRNINISESNYKVLDVVKLLMYRKQLRDENFQKYLSEGELRKVKNALNTAKHRIKLALLYQCMIHKWHDFTEIVEGKKKGEDIPRSHAENSLNNKLFNYLVGECIKELKELCAKEWPGFDEFYNSL